MTITDDTITVANTRCIKKLLAMIIGKPNFTLDRTYYYEDEESFAFDRTRAYKSEGGLTATIYENSGSEGKEVCTEIVVERGEIAISITANTTYDGDIAVGEYEDDFSKIAEFADFWKAQFDAEKAKAKLIRDLHSTAKSYAEWYLSGKCTLAKAAKEYGFSIAEFQSIVKSEGVLSK